MADCAMPLEAASDLKSSSHAPKLPVPQGAAGTDAAGIIRTALNAMALDRNRKLILQNASGNRGQNKALAGLTVFVIGRPSAIDGRCDDKGFSGWWLIRRSCAATGTGWPGNPPPNAARASHGEAA